MKDYQYILLDWDGNLAKTLDIWLDAFRTVLNQEGHFPSDEEIAGSFGKVVAYFEELGIRNVAEAYDRADQIGRTSLPNVELYPDALEVLAYFKKIHKKTALITSSPHANIHDLLKHYDMLELFDAIIAADDVTNHKPHPEPLLKALETLGGTVDKALMIGDSDKDLGAAKNAGVDSVLFYPDEHKKFYNLDSLKKYSPTHIVDDFRRIMTIVR